MWFIFLDWTLTDADINIRFLLLNSWQIVRIFMIAHTLTIFPLGFMIFKLAIFYLLCFILNQRLIVICFFMRGSSTCWLCFRACRYNGEKKPKQTNNNHCFYESYILMMDQTKVNN